MTGVMLAALPWSCDSGVLRQTQISVELWGGVPLKSCQWTIGGIKLAKSRTFEMDVMSFKKIYRDNNCVV